MSFPTSLDALVDSEAYEHTGSLPVKQAIQALQAKVGVDASAVTTSLDFKTALFFRGNGSPEGAVAAIVGALYLRTDGGAGTTLYIKETGAGNTGWAAK